MSYENNSQMGSNTCCFCFSECDKLSQSCGKCSRNIVGSVFNTETLFCAVKEAVDVNKRDEECKSSENNFYDISDAKSINFCGKDTDKYGVTYNQRNNYVIDSIIKYREGSYEFPTRSSAGYYNVNTWELLALHSRYVNSDTIVML